MESAPKVLTSNELGLLEKQNSRLVPDHKVKTLVKDAHKHWDIFYKRNETRYTTIVIGQLYYATSGKIIHQQWYFYSRFFRDRHWTTREFIELAGEGGMRRIVLEVGCGVGNFVYPLIAEKRNFYFLACDFSSRAVDFVKSNHLYNEKQVVFSLTVSPCSSLE